MKHNKATGAIYKLLLLAALFIYGCNGNAQTSQVANSANGEAKKDTVFARLKEKAQIAKEFCETKKLNTEFCVLVDFSLHSGRNRLFIWDFKRDTITHKSLCAHGYGKGSTKRTPVFSNVEGSYCSSLGKYKIGAKAPSQWGIKIHYKLHGLESTNSNAFKRWVVLHSYSPVPTQEIYPTHLPLGWSQGCPVVSDEMMRTLNDLLESEKKSVLLWIFN